ncbi:MAG: EscV/YscV/HrcV family type III secretion system export apparatus protein [Mesorhizobium sp.]|uniref:type III secretion system export apparatus subunit SctV n=1 Tax=unclassified Mesorhizobium TaxID=325217 RepID=UPI000FE6D466|nr:MULTISPECIES: type III secretion system export apparatus subunit SctV [unclassified Mesorhizobium]RWA97518.1 MAG: EscV/YscV/HrcV family type III secretion system export apparatus protein [Mesorhizobium sp.]RWC24369.1 MAG: EscV/YscV/HrcV family type III secretion system export apparatus protein [Mesorhizobium sp.]RWD77661.1 MAG: EscV/YscV/HrcV family type III secretion system export apparatus protein [Mesorhizobium sp.]RWE52767.1 MAG: EscV/YscV/HrcV family type III secretion system export app
MANVLRDFIKRAPASPDLMVALMLLLAVAMMVMPIPVVVVDALIGFNMGLAILLMMVALYVSTPLDFSSLPGVILISTVFRLALTVATTRLILAEGEAGSIIHTFGDFVISGNIVVGFVIFLVVTMVQFMVLAKGAERVAEVAARFTLDALPGKQMAVDAELRNGHIDANESRRRRAELEKESQLYGAMDGAMKFVKGDSIAGLVVICINMLGGISIGLLSKGMSFGEVLHHYTLLTIGDALISQIPALLLSITAATIVTRVTGTARINLGTEMVSQLTASTRALRLAAGVLVVMGFVPGFPLPVFLMLAAVFAAVSIVKADVLGAGTADAKDGTAAEPKQAAPAKEFPIAFFLAPNLMQAIDQAELQKHIGRVSLLVTADLGIIVPRIPVLVDEQLPASQFRIDVEGVPVEQDAIDPSQMTLRADVAHVDSSGIPLRREPKTDRLPVEHTPAQALTGAGTEHRAPGELLALRVHAALTRYAPRLVGIQETRHFLGRMEQEYSELVKEVLRTTPIPRIADVLRRLLEEGIPIRHTRLVLEALAEWSEREQNVALLTEYVRSGLKRQICHRYANTEGIVSALVVERESEDVLRGAVRDSDAGPYLALEDRQSEAMLSQIRQVVSNTEPGQTRPILLTSMDVRRFVRGFLTRNGIDLAVLSYQDLASDFTIRPAGSVKLPHGSNSGLLE